MPKAKQFVTDENGVRVAVMLDIKEYEELLDDLEDLQAVREYGEAKPPAKYQFRWNKRLTKFAAIASEQCGKHSAKRSKETGSNPLSFPREYFGENAVFGSDSQTARLQDIKWQRYVAYLHRQL